MCATEDRLYMSAMLAHGTCGRMQDQWRDAMSHHRCILEKLDALPTFHEEHQTRTWVILKRIEIFARVASGRAERASKRAMDFVDNATWKMLDFIPVRIPS